MNPELAKAAPDAADQPEQPAPAEDRTAKQPDQPTEQPAMDADWPEAARPGNPT